MILIALFQQHLDGWNRYWTIEQVGATIQVDADTWPRNVDGVELWSNPCAIGIVTVTHADGVWRAECQHPDGEEVAAAGFMDKDEALEALRIAVRGRHAPRGW